MVKVVESNFNEELIEQVTQNENSHENQEERLSAKSTVAALITRRQWKARKSDFRIDTFKAPVPYVVIHQTSTESCNTLSECEKQVRQIEDIHINSKRLSDISYNFLVGGDDGYIFEARGWTKVGAHINRYNSVSIGIAFIGLFEDKLPSNASLSATQELIRMGMEENYIKRDYKLFGMRQLSNSIDNPGQQLYDIIKKWPHWSYGLHSLD
ncbi:peptidoglycan recognition protein [Holotrichia oblita]|uniref:Peptidoglycan recognition protein n=1 Tax=Holotrichia oblita TaxID=644536 RepID=A0ACB9T2N2_HOLOL|nr:peptidoglycan recognition protein [Holotrichia oblita]